MQIVKDFPLSTAAARRMGSWRRGDSRGRWIGAAIPLPPPIRWADRDATAPDVTGVRAPTRASTDGHDVPSSNRDRRLACVRSPVDAVTDRNAPRPQPNTIASSCPPADFLPSGIARADDEHDG